MIFSDSSNVVEDSDNPLDNDRLGATETMLLTDVPQPDDISIAPGEGTKPMSILMDEKMRRTGSSFFISYRQIWV